MPGVEILTDAVSQMRAIRSGNEENTILTFNGSHAEVKEAIKRARELKQTLTEPNLYILGSAKAALDKQWSFLRNEPDIGDELASKAEELGDLLKRETFFQQIPTIDQHAKAIRNAYTERFDATVAGRAEVYGDAVSRLKAGLGWEQLEPDQQERIAHDWSHLAMHLWPERVVPKCRTDASLAIAHGLEDVFWQQDDKGKWVAKDAPQEGWETVIEKLVAERTSPAVKGALESLLNAPAPSNGRKIRNTGKRRKKAR